jgi:hypothetical protein
MPALFLGLAEQKQGILQQSDNQLFKCILQLNFLTYKYVAKSNLHSTLVLSNQNAKLA